MSSSQLHFGLGSFTENGYIGKLLFYKSYVMLRSGRKGFHFLEVASMLLDSM